MPCKSKCVSWLSSGVSSFVSAWLLRSEIDEYIYIDISDQHPDSLRFIHDCSDLLGKPVLILKNHQYDSVGDVISSFRFIKSAYGARCTEVLKRRVRKEWEYAHQDYDLTYVWGFDSSEQDRASRLEEAMPFCCHRFPLIERNLTKQDAHAICKALGLKRPIMYDLGYPNNNCIGCVKGGIGYWNKIRVDFPDVFKSRSELERLIGHSILRDRGQSLFLDELPPDKGRKQKIILEDCGIFCQVALESNGGDSDV